MSKVGCFAKIVAKPGRRDELVAAVQPLLDAVEAEDGTLVYVLHADNNEADAVWVYEVYADDAAFKAHARSETMKALQPALGGLVAAPLELHMTTPLGGKGF